MKLITQKALYKFLLFIHYDPAVCIYACMYMCVYKTADDSNIQLQKH